MLIRTQYYNHLDLGNIYQFLWINELLLSLSMCIMLFLLHNYYFIIKKLNYQNDKQVYRIIENNLKIVKYLNPLL